MLSINHLPNHLSGEKVEKIVRRDLFILFKRIMMLLFLIILPLIFFYLMLSIYPGMLGKVLPNALIVLGTSIYYLFVWLFFGFSFIDYYLDVWIITNRRIIDIQQQGFFSRIVAEQKLFRVQDVTSEAHGVFPTFLKYGEVYIQTAGTKQRFIFHEVPDPHGIRDLIISLVEKNKRKRIEGEKSIKK
jgi:signal transduction histidine kinase